jgi:pRiA4b ORF-3-like protein
MLECLNGNNSVEVMSATAGRISSCPKTRKRAIGSGRSLSFYKSSTHVIEDTGTKTLRYFYDFGDGWEHSIIVERHIDHRPAALTSSIRD